MKGPKASIIWSPLLHRWVVAYVGIFHYFVHWDNAIYFANYAAATGIHGAPHMYEGE